MPGARLFARRTIATAFHRIRRLMRRSNSSSPGKNGSCSGLIVLMYRVWVSGGRPTCSCRARLRILYSRKRVRSSPSWLWIWSRASIHSCVSAGSMSGSWCLNSSKYMAGELLRAGEGFWGRFVSTISPCRLADRPAGVVREVRSGRLVGWMRGPHATRSRWPVQPDAGGPDSPVPCKGRTVGWSRRWQTPSVISSTWKAGGNEHSAPCPGRR